MPAVPSERPQLPRQKHMQEEVRMSARVRIRANAGEPDAHARTSPANIIISHCLAREV